MQIEVDVQGMCTGRNGTFDIGKVVVESLGEDDINIGCVTRGLRRRLNAGMVINVAAMDELATKWLMARGGDGKSENRLQKVRSLLVEMLEYIDKAKDDTNTQI